MTQDAIEWLKKQDCLVRAILVCVETELIVFFYMQDDKEKFEAHGYWNLSYIVSMTRKVAAGFFCDICEILFLPFVNRNSKLLVYRGKDLFSGLKRQPRSFLLWL